MNEVVKDALGKPVLMFGYPIVVTADLPNQCRHDIVLGEFPGLPDLSDMPPWYAGKCQCEIGVTCAYCKLWVRMLGD